MTNKGRKLEPPLYIDMPFDEAMKRFLQADPAEVEELEQQKKATRPEPDGHLIPPDEPSGSDQ